MAAKASKKSTSDILDDDYKERVRLLRWTIQGDSQKEFAQKLGISGERWNNYERGFPVSREVCFTLFERIDGFSSDWLYFGLDTLREPLRSSIKREEKNLKAAAQFLSREQRR